MEELLKEILESIKTRQKGVIHSCYDWKTERYVNKTHQPERGIGTKAYTIRRIQMLEDKLKQLKKDLINGKYDFKW